MKRSDVWWVGFGPSVGGEIQKRRPAVIVSNDAANEFLNRVQVVPLTTRADKLYPNEAYVTVQGRRAKAMADQVTTVSKLRLTSRIGALTSKEMAGIARAITIQLGL